MIDTKSAIFHYFILNHQSLDKKKNFLSNNKTIQFTETQRMIRRSCNFQLSEILDCSELHNRSSTVNEFGNFIYKDHVTRIKYNVENLKSKKKPTTIYEDQTIESLMKTHKQTKSMDSFGKIKSRFQSENLDEFQVKKNELVHFLKDLEMMKKIRKNRNQIVSGTDKVERNKSIFPCILPSYLTADPKTSNIDILKQQIRKQVSELSTELFREYLQNSESYRTVFNELSIASSKGALNTGKIKQIKRKIEECIKRKHNQTNKKATNKKRELDSKENDKYDEFFSTLAKQIDEEIHLKMNHQATFNWKYGKRQPIEDVSRESQISLERKINV